jgi:tRNA nucleotidyltransferase (CCA-adding enzyme)
MKYRTYLVGGAVRDELLGIPCKDLDFVVLAPSFKEMKKDLLEQGCKIFVEKPQYLTIRAKHPKLGCVDFACARKGNYTDGGRPDETVLTISLAEDLERRDFTCNAIAKNVLTGDIIDLFEGQKHIEDRRLEAVGGARARFNEDKLRMFRALRFAVTKGFRLSHEISNAIGAYTPLQFKSVSTERIREEILKMFRLNPARSFRLLNNNYPMLWEVVMERGIWFRPTTEDR